MTEYIIIKRALQQWVLTVNGTNLNTYQSRAGAYCAACLLLGNRKGSIEVKR